MNDCPQTDAAVRFKSRLTLEDISEWWRFRQKMDELPYDEVIPIKMSELRIKVRFRSFLKKIKVRFRSFLQNWRYESNLR